VRQQSCPVALVMSLNPPTTGLLGYGVSATRLSNRLSRSSWRARRCWLSTARLLGSARAPCFQNPVQPVLLRECLQGRARAVRARAQSGQAPGGLAAAAHQAPSKGGAKKRRRASRWRWFMGPWRRQSLGHEGAGRVARLARRVQAKMRPTRTHQAGRSPASQGGCRSRQKKPLEKLKIAPAPRRPARDRRKSLSGLVFFKRGCQGSGLTAGFCH
jgi:hypothetical protein